jgi:hypothetical protein
MGKRANRGGNLPPPGANNFPQTQTGFKDPAGGILRLIGGIFGLVGFGLLVGAFFAWQGQRAFLRDSVPGVGTVVGLQERLSQDSKTGRRSTTYAPVVEFKTSNGKIRQFTSGVSSAPPSHRVGDSVPVVYDARSPEKAEINNFFSLWFVPVLLGGMGSVFSIVGVTLFALALKSG